MAIKLRNIIYNKGIKLLLILSVVISSVSVAYILIDVVEHGDYVVPDYFYETNVFYKTYLHAATLVLLEAPLEDIHKVSSTLWFAKVTGSDGLDADMEKRYNGHYSFKITPNSLEFLPKSKLTWNSGAWRIGELQDVVLKKLGPSGSAYFILDYMNDRGEIGMQYHEFTQFKLKMVTYQYHLGIVGVLVLLAFYLLTLGAGKGAYLDQPQLHWFDKVPLELILLSVFVSSGPMLLVLDNFNEWNQHSIGQGIALGTGALWVLVSMVAYMSVVRRIKGKCFWRSAWSVSFILWMLQALSPKQWRAAFKPYLTLMFLGTLLVHMILAIIAIISNGELGVFILLILIVLDSYLVIWLNKQLGAFMHLNQYIKGLVDGNMQDEMDIKRITPIFEGVATDLKHLHDGLDRAVREAVKGERMRTDLVTNVTHDLKNPLTSIINYIDLLSDEPQLSQNSHNYIEVLKDKSDRLKALIDHLVEASKLSSGVVTVETEVVDLVNFIKQIEGEYSESMANKGLNLVVNCQLQEAPIIADVKMLARIIDNLLSNVDKYGLGGTRVYLDLGLSADGRGYNLSLKNISKHALSSSSQDLTERFVRGDASRNTEGNGLGLSIATSLAQAMKMQLHVSFDADLFKVSLYCPK